MTMTTTLLEERLAALPAPFDTAAVGAWVQHQRRELVWTLKEPGELFRNRYWMAWVTVRETAGSLHCYGERRPTEHGGREPFTGKGREQIGARLLPHLLDFDTVWHALRARRADPTHAQQRAEEARSLGQWWDLKADLDEMHHDGMLYFLPVSDPRSIRVRRPDSGRGHFADVLASAWYSDTNLQVGWMTVDGDVLPVDQSLLG